MLFSLVFAFAAQSIATPKSIDLNSFDAVILAKGLERELDGKFLLVGLTEAERACRITSACLARDQFKQEASRAVNADDLDVKTLLSSVRVDNQSLRYVVAIRAIQQPANSAGLKIIMSVFDSEQRRWRLATAYAAPTPDVVTKPIMIHSRTFQSFRYQPG